VFAQYWFAVRRDGSEHRISLRERPIESVPITITVSAAEGTK
jgi:hypothetical protein